MSERIRLEAFVFIDRKLQDANSPHRRTTLLATVVKYMYNGSPAHIPHGQDLRTFLASPSPLRLPAGMTLHDVWEVCQHQWCYLKVDEPHPDWLVTDEQIISERQHHEHVCLASEHPLTILLHWSLALHNDSSKLKDPQTLQHWHERASSLPSDHGIWRLVDQQAEDRWLQQANGSPVELHGYVRIWPEDSGMPTMFLKWAVSTEQARFNIQKLALFAKGDLQTMLRMLLPGSSQPGTNAAAYSDTAEAHTGRTTSDIGADALPFFIWRHRAEMADRLKRADLSLLHAQPARYVRRLLHQCRLISEGKLTGLTGAPPNAHGQAARLSEVQEPGSVPGPDADSLRRLQQQADEAAQKLLLEEEAAKAKAQARKDAKQQRRTRKRDKAHSKPDLPQDTTHSAGAQAAQQSGQGGEASLAADHVMLPALHHHEQLHATSIHPEQEIASPASGREETSALCSSSTSPHPHILSSPSSAMTSPPAVDHQAPLEQNDAACERNSDALQMQQHSLRLGWNDGADQVTQAERDPDRKSRAADWQ